MRRHAYVSFLLLTSACLYGVADIVTDKDTISGVDAGDPEAPRTCGSGLTSCGGWCANTSNDPKNCGACGHDCLGGACQAGGCAPVVLASGQSQPLPIAVDSAYVYWTTYPSGVMRCALDGKDQPTKLIGANTGFGLGVSSARVYWTDLADNTVMSCLLASCGATPPVGTANNPMDLAIDSVNVYWTNSAMNGSVMKCALGGCAGSPIPLASGQVYPEGVAAGGGVVYWTAIGSGTVMSCKRDGCNNQPTLIASKQDVPTSIVVDATHVYWTTYNGGTIMSAPVDVDAGAPTQLAGLQLNPRGIAVDDANVYWTNAGDGTIMKCAKTGCSDVPTPIAKGQLEPRHIAVDATSIYWTNAASDGGLEAGTVMRLAK